MLTYNPSSKIKHEDELYKSLFIIIKLENSGNSGNKSKKYSYVKTIKNDTINT